MAYDFTTTSNQYLSIPSTPVSSMPMTISCWFSVKNTSGGKAFVSVGETTSAQRNQIGILNNVPTIFSVGTSITSATSSAAVADTLYHLCGVFESTTSRTIYFNGLNGVQTTTNSGTQNAANSILIGARYLLTAYHSGIIAEVGIWNAVLTADEIASLAKGMTCDKVRPQSLVFYAPLVRDLQDVRGGLTITNNNGATVADHPRVYA
jgi:hypothetical protein